MNEIRHLLEAALDHPAFRAAREALARGEKQASLSGLTPPAQALVAAALQREFSRPLIFITSDNEAADRLRAAAATFLGWLGGEPASAATLPSFDALPYDQLSPHPEICERRAVALWSAAQGRARLLFVPLPAALGRFREKTFYGSLAIELKPGEEVGRDDLVEHLVRVGYEPGEPVDSLGQFSVRGGIVDVFPPECDWPCRIEFLDDQIESLREFDPATQRSRRPAERALLLPLTEFPRAPGFFQELAEELVRRESRLGTKLRAGRSPDWTAEYSAPFPGWEFFAPLALPHRHALNSLFDSPLVVWDNFGERRRQLLEIHDAWAVRYDEVRDVVPHRPQPQELLMSEEEFLKVFQAAPQVLLQELAMGAGDPVLVTRPSPKFHGAVKTLASDTRERLSRRERVVFVLPTSGKMDRLREIMREYEIPFQTAGAPVATSGNAESTPGAALLVAGEMEDGVDFADLGLVLETDRDLFGEFVWAASKRRERPALASFLSDLSDLKVGDYVVHLDHGVGLYRGLSKVSVEGASRDFMLLTYQDDARLYVPLERLDLVEKYRTGGDGAAKPQLDRLGGTRWARTKSRVRRALRDMAGELLRLYAERKMLGGVAASPDTPWQKEFEQAFEFEETPDQLKALEELKRDLEEPQPMDRLLCGDVGYGKTELAMRAAFKVVQDGRQVAVLAPTTVLAFQHYITFRQRLAPFPVRVEMLSRFRSAAEQKKIVAEAEAGRVDVLIGTHRLLSRDVRFRELGLLIVDEEQRFGVAAKERLKKLRVGVDVLTLSATPIPRTLHMAVGGLRDLSVIETPPRGRLSIQTVVAPFSDGLVQSAILQELGRQGQVFFVHNRVESIFSIAALLQRLVPTARFGVAHGQMGEKELERAMLKFVEGQYDVLVSTALIENGLDIPRANTMIINHAHRFGLADLYQLRGRVGRSNRRAYAYLLVPSDRTLTPLAQRRLAALKEFSDLGAGFRLAALDLELRGAGNLLGAEQSGHLNAVGVDLYMQMLAEAVDELKGQAPHREVRTTLNLGLDIKIPGEYVPDENQRLRLYKRISSLPSPEARGELEAELADRYGSLPASVLNLLAYAQLKSLAESLLVESIERKADQVWVRFDAQAPVEPGHLKAFVRQRRGAQFRPDGTLSFRLAAPDAALPGEIANALRELRPST